MNFAAKPRLLIILVGLGVLGALIAVGSSIWFRLPRTYRFIAQFDGQLIPYLLKLDPTTERFRKEASRESTSYAFKADPKQVETAMVEELVAAGWTRFETGERSVDFIRGDIRDSTYKGMPVQELESVTDFATLISDRSMLDIPPEVTCVAIITEKSNLAEAVHRFKQRAKGTEGAE